MHLSSIAFGVICPCKPRSQPVPNSCSRKRSPVMALNETKRVMKIAVCQMLVIADKDKNLETARSFLKRAHAASANLAVLPECFQTPYSTSAFRAYAETIPPSRTSPDSPHHSPSLKMLQSAAVETGMYIVGGSIPEIDGDNIYNTSLTVSPSGTLIAKHRKTHLFDVDVPGGITFRESDVLSPGNSATVFEAPELGCKVGVSICYDVRFPELAMVQARQLGAKVLVFPGAFNLTTGPGHWEVLMRARALDNQVYVAACSPARLTNGEGYMAWGHSMVVDPWGTVLQEADENEALVLVDINLEKVESMRKAIPIGSQRREDIYDLRYLK